jgi:hypothetical protein
MGQAEGRQMLRALLIVLLALGPAATKLAAQQSALAGELSKEGAEFKDSCLKLSIGGCAGVLFTGHPLHIAMGSIAPQNGFGAGAAFVTHYDGKNWLLKSDVDAVGSINGSWRAGAYLKIIPTPARTIRPVVNRAPSGPTPHKSKLRVVDYPLISLYAQAISLNKLEFFGLGNTTSLAGRSFFGERETIVGSSVILPVPPAGKLNLAILGEINGRFVEIRSPQSGTTPSITSLYTPATAPGLNGGSAFAQFGAGVRIKPSLFQNFLRLNYLVNLQQFVSGGDSFTFRRFTTDLNHEIPFYHSVTATAKDANGPDECASNSASGDLRCPPIVSTSNNREGAINLRFLLTESVASGGNVVPFYFQPTLGGSDINGNPVLSSYPDYRFRGPDVMLFHAGIEHTIPGLDRLKYPVPLGVFFGADAGKVAVARDDLGFDHLRHSFSSGLTLRAGGFPQVFLLFAWGGHEGTHVIANVNTALLGGSNRPSLF